MSDDGQPPVPGPFGRYHLLSRLGAGGMGAVYLAHDPQLDRRVALKIPSLGVGRDALARERFLREARAAAAFVHPNVCPVYEVGECGGIPYLTMGYIEGQTLAARLDPDRPPDVGWSVNLVRMLARALSEAHGRGVVHRDLKPSNVMIDARGEPVLLDFGLALSTRGGDPRLTAAGALAGTPAYMPPEYARGGSRADPAGDVYSLGAVLYELLTGRPPFVGDSVEVLAQALCAAPEPPSARRPGVPPELDSACLTALAKEPEDRFASMAAFAAALDRRNVGPKAAPTTVRPVGTRVGRPGTGRLATVGVAAGVLVFLTAAGLGYAVWRSGAEPARIPEEVREPEPRAAEPPAALPAPVQLFPSDGRVFDEGAPRRTLLVWAAVPGAARHEAEVEHQTGGDWLPIHGTLVVRQGNTTFEFYHTGAQPGRWRVWAVGPDGQPGVKSGWRTFTYLH